MQRVPRASVEQMLEFMRETTSSAARSSGSRTSPVERVAQAATSVETTAS